MEWLHIFPTFASVPLSLGLNKQWLISFATIFVVDINVIINQPP